MRLVPSLGTSIGALVGGCALAGKLDVLEDLARTMNWRRLLRYADAQMGAPGLIKGDTLVADLEKNLGAPKIEDLSRPFAAVAADLVSGREVWLRTGSLAQAVRASVSIPGVFVPVQSGGSFLVDGGLTNPVPVSAARALGADIVVAIDVTGDYAGRAEAAGIGRALRPAPAKDRSSWTSHFKGVAGRLFDRSQRRPGLYSVGVISAALIMRELAKAKMTQIVPDMHVIPIVGHVSPVEFDKADFLIGRGAEAMEASLPELRRIIAAKHMPAPATSEPAADPR